MILIIKYNERKRRKQEREKKKNFLIVKYSIVGLNHRLRSPIAMHNTAYLSSCQLKQSCPSIPKRKALQTQFVIFHSKHSQVDRIC